MSNLLLAIKNIIRPVYVLVPGSEGFWNNWAAEALDQLDGTTYEARTEGYILRESRTKRLNERELEQRIQETHEHMRQDLNTEGFFKKLPESLILQKRETPDGVRYSLVALIDLEQYSLSPDGTTLIRASEGTTSKLITRERWI